MKGRDRDRLMLRRYSFIQTGVVLFLLLCPFVVARAQGSEAPQISLNPSVESSQRITAYTLPPERHRLAHELNRKGFVFRVVSFLYGVLVLILIIYTGVSARLRSIAEKVSTKRFVQVVIFTSLLLILISALTLPTDMYGHLLGIQYGLSIQSWGSWLFDWVKQLAINLIGAAILIWLLYLIISKSPRRWWFYFWLISLPIGLFLVFIQPLIIDPAFNSFEPLAQKNVVLAKKLSEMSKSAGEDIPVERMFWMDASEKTTTLNAYVTGFGASKRIVVWDTTIEKLTTSQIVFVAGHEMGHYVLHHIVKGLLWAAVLSLLLFFIFFHASRWLIATNVSRWNIRGVDDYASLPVLLLLLTVLMFLGTPVSSAISRYYEHQADQYSLDITHSLTPDSKQVCAQAFQRLGEVGLSDPDPNPINVFWFYDHPPIAERVKFCLEYNPQVSTIMR